MDAPSGYLAERWLAAALVAVAGAALLYARTRSARAATVATWVTCGAAALAGVGGIVLPESLASWVAAAAAAILGAMLIFLFFTSVWAAPLGWLAGASLVLGLGGWLLPRVQAALTEACRFAGSVRLQAPPWLILLLLLPLVAWSSLRSLAGLGPMRRVAAVSLRSLVLACVILALAEAQGRRGEDSLTVLFVWDRSLSMPREPAAEGDLRERRVFDFINRAVARRPVSRASDQVGVVVFGREAKVDLSAGRVPTLHYRRVFSAVDPTYTDIAAALRMARASFPQGTGRRIVLISDGNENLGQAIKEAEAARLDGVEIDIVPVEVEARAFPEVIVEFVDAPAVVDPNARIPVRVRLRNLSSETVEGTLLLFKKSLEVGGVERPPDKVKDDDAKDGWPRRLPLRVPPGLKEVYEQVVGLAKNEACVLEAVFLPVIDGPDGRPMPNPRLAKDRPENNRASVGIVARGERAVLLVEAEPGQHRLLTRRLQHDKSPVKVVAAAAAALPKDAEALAFILGKFDAVILANVPADMVTEEQQKVLRSAVYDQGLGLIMIGGPQAFGAGGWQGTEVEKALPVLADLKSLQLDARSGLVLIMHASEMAEGNAWQRKVAKLAVERLAPVDMLGMIYWDHLAGAGHTWHIPFQEVGKNKARMLNLIDALNPGDMPEVDSAFVMAHKQLTKKEYNLGARHIILISDGDHWTAGAAALNALRRDKITCTTVCITTHGPGERRRMEDVALATGGRFHDVRDPAKLPAIYVKETRLVSKAFTHEEKFRPRFRKGEERGPVGDFTDADLASFYGFVRTTRRSSPLVSVPIETPKIGEHPFPLLAFWQYGLGKSVAFTSDARSIPKGPDSPDDKAYWDRDWAGSGAYTRFWEQMVQWSLRPIESGKILDLETRIEDGKVKAVVRARDADRAPLVNLKLDAGLTSPSFKGPDARRPSLEFEQVGPGVYEAEFRADEVGTFFLNVRASWVDQRGKPHSDSVRGAIGVPYSPEFAEPASRLDTLEKLREMTGGNRYLDDADALRHTADSGVLFRPAQVSQTSLQALWPWLLLCAGCFLVLEVAVRRIAIEPRHMAQMGVRLWARLRGRAVAETPIFLERLRSRKAEVSEGIRKQAARRFEPPAGAARAEAPALEAPAGAAPPVTPPTTPGMAPQADEEPADFASRLLRAKKKAIEDRDKR